MNAFVPTARLRINARDEDWWQGNTTDTLVHIAETAHEWGRYGRPAIYLPYEEGDPWWLPKEGLRLTWPMELYGDGQNEAWGLRPWADPEVPDLKGTKDSNGLVFCTWGMYIHDLTISNDRGPTEIGRGNGISLDYSGLDQRTAGDNLIERVHILYAGNCGMKFDPTNGLTDEGFIITTTIRDCVVYGCAWDGVVFNRGTTLDVRQVNCIWNGGVGWRIKGCETSEFAGIVSENNGRNLEVATASTAAIYLQGCESSKIRAHMETFTNGRVRDGLVLDGCNAVTVESGLSGDWNPQARGHIGVRLRNSKDCVVLPQRTTDFAGYAVRGEGNLVGNVIFPQERPVAGIDWKKNTRLWS